MKLILGDCVEAMASMEPESIDAVCTDPPYGIRFMGQAWDGKAIEEEAAKPWNAEGHMRLTGSPDSPNRKLIHRSGSAYRTRAGTAGAYDFSLKGNYAFQEWTEQWATQALRVLKPGGHLLSFSSTRTFHRMVCGIEDAGFQIRDTLMWIQGQGFPKSLNLPGGYGTNLKPSFEPIVLARKPPMGRIQENVTRYGTGVLNIDATRIAATDSFDQVGVTHNKETSEQGYQVVQRSTASPAARRRQGKTPEREGGIWANDRRSAGTYGAEREGEQLGRWPANILVSHTEECRLLGTETVDGRTIRRPVEKMLPFGGGKGKEYDTIEFPDEEVELWECVEGCAVAELDRQSGASPSSGGGGVKAPGGHGIYGSYLGKEYGPLGYGDRGGASRFFFAPRRYKIEGCEHVITAASSSSPTRDEAESDSALNDAATSAHQGESLSGRHSEQPSMSATESESSKSYENATPPIPSTEKRSAQESPLTKLSQTNNLASHADQSGPIDTMMTTTNPLRSDGSAEDAMLPNTSSNTAPGEVGFPFRYQPKVSPAERHAGAENFHPTVKSIDLMRWLCRLVTPQGGVVLDPFMGSGSTGIAATLEGLDFIGCEQDEKYMKIAEGRIAWWTEHGADGLRIVSEEDAKLRAAAKERERLAEMGQMDLFTL